MGVNKTVGNANQTDPINLQQCNLICNTYTTFS